MNKCTHHYYQAMSRIMSHQLLISHAKHQSSAGPWVISKCQFLALTTTALSFTKLIRHQKILQSNMWLCSHFSVCRNRLGLLLLWLWSNRSGMIFVKQWYRCSDWHRNINIQLCESFAQFVFLSSSINCSIVWQLLTWYTWLSIGAFLTAASLRATGQYTHACMHHQWLYWFKDWSAIFNSVQNTEKSLAAETIEAVDIRAARHCQIPPNRQHNVSHVMQKMMLLASTKTDSWIDSLAPTIKTFSCRTDAAVAERRMRTAAATGGHSSETAS